MRLLEGKNAIITGCNRGIGKTTMELFASCGSNIWACARAPDRDFEKNIEELAEKYDVVIEPLFFEMTDEIAMKNAVQMIRKSKRDIDILVNVAGMLPDSTNYWMTTIEKMKTTFEVNFFATTLLTQYVSRLMSKNPHGGSIINIASIVGIDGGYAPFEYVTSKAALIGATKYLAQDLSRYGIRVNAIAPGWSKTRMIDGIDEGTSDAILSRVSLGRYGETKEIANVIAFIASDSASFITGQVIRVDGGFH